MKTKNVIVTKRSSVIGGKVVKTKSAYVFARPKHVSKIKIMETAHFDGPEESNFDVSFPFSAEVIICQEDCYNSTRSITKYQNGQEFILFESTIFAEDSSEKYNQTILDLQKRFNQVF